MVGKEEWGQYPAPAPTPNSTQPQKKFWRSSSWSPSRTASHNPDGCEKDGVDFGSNVGNNGGGHGRKFPVPLTPRSSSQNSKARSCLPPLQPLSIARRSLDEWPRAGSDDIGEWPAGPMTPGGRDVRERLKLDLSVIQINLDKSGGLCKRDKIAFFDKECSKVAEHIYVGGDAVARDRDILKQNRITHVLNCVGFVCPEYFKSDFVYRTLWLQDSPSEDITSILYDVFDYFEDVREQKGKVFVHCCQGVSRSTSLAIAYLMWREGRSFDDAFQYVKQARGIADPNMGFACQLLQCQKRVHAFPLSPSSSLRMYRMAPHSRYDPLHLVPKMLNDPSPSALDSRGAFIVQVPSAIYVWIGKRCEVVMERDARGAVCQILRYEKVQVPVHVIKEGEETPSFWRAFSDFSLEKSGNGGAHGISASKILHGERNVKQYDVDFEIFLKATMEGSVTPFSSSEAEHEARLPAWESSWSVLRRKFASGHMKEFVAAPKLGSNKVYLDSQLNGIRDDLARRPPLSSDVTLMPSALSSSSTSSPSSLSLSSLSPSPPYLSPDSLTSDSSSSSKYSLGSPLDSPLALTSPLSNLSSLSTDTVINISSHPQYIEVNFPSRRSQKSISPSQRSLLSIAERRGSMSQFLKLPIMADDTRKLDAKGCTGCVHNDTDTNDTCLLSEPSNGETAAVIRCSEILGFQDADKIDMSLRSVSGLVESVSAANCDKNSRNMTPTRCSEREVLLGAVEIEPRHYADKHPSVYCLPDFEKPLCVKDVVLDSNSAFAFVFPKEYPDAAEDWILYLWVGRTAVEENRMIADVDYADLSHLRYHILSKIAFPEDTEMKEAATPTNLLVQC
ncbi:Protein-tyrosine-phosphatase MKP1-like protein [Drosera capensis]